MHISGYANSSAKYKNICYGDFVWQTTLHDVNIRRFKHTHNFLFRVSNFYNLFKNKTINVPKKFTQKRAKLQMFILTYNFRSLSHRVSTRIHLRLYPSSVPSRLATQHTLPLPCIYTPVSKFAFIY